MSERRPKHGGLHLVERPARLLCAKAEVTQATNASSQKRAAAEPQRCSLKTAVERSARNGHMQRDTSLEPTEEHQAHLTPRSSDASGEHIVGVCGGRRSSGRTTVRLSGDRCAASSRAGAGRRR